VAVTWVLLCEGATRARAGFNSFTLLEQAAQVCACALLARFCTLEAPDACHSFSSQLPRGSFGADYSNGKGRAQVTRLLDDAQRAGLNVLRMWAFTVSYVMSVIANTCRFFILVVVERGR
jgi:hypothetical protein